MAAGGAGSSAATSRELDKFKTEKGQRELPLET
jgi:hypothetical protein